MMPTTTSSLQVYSTSNRLYHLGTSILRCARKFVMGQQQTILEYIESRMQILDSFFKCIVHFNIPYTENILDAIHLLQVVYIACYMSINSRHPLLSIKFSFNFSDWFLSETHSTMYLIRKERFIPYNKSPCHRNNWNSWKSKMRSLRVQLLFFGGFLNHSRLSKIESAMKNI